MTKKQKRRKYFSFVRKATVIETGYIAVDAYNDPDAQDAAIEGRFAEFLCESREYKDNDWTFEMVESPTSD